MNNIQTLINRAEQHADDVDHLQGLPVVAAIEGGMFPPFTPPEEPPRLHPDLVQMMDDMAQCAP